MHDNPHRAEEEEDRRLPYWVLLAISQRSRRLRRWEAIVGALLAVLASVSCFVVGSTRHEGAAFALIFGGVAFGIMAIYLWWAIRWIDRRKAWQWGPHPMRL